MNTSTDNNTNAGTLMSTIGESYEYLNVIIKNNIEIKKLEFVKIARVAAGKFVFLLALLTIAFFIGILLIALMTVGFFQLLSSWPYALLATIGVLILLTLLLYIFRSVLFYRFFQNLVDNITKTT